MANPSKPDIDYSYTGFQQEQQENPFPGTQLDNDLAELKRGTDDTIDALADVRRSDGALKNGIVTDDSLSPNVFAGIDASRDAALTAAQAATTQAGVASAQAAVSTAKAAEAGVSASVAADFASDIVSQGSVPIYATRTGLGSLIIPDSIDNITLNGYASADDGGEGKYRRVSAGDVTGLPAACYRQDASGAYWLDDDKEPQPQKYGVINDNFVSDSTAAWNLYFACMAALSRPMVIKTFLRSRITDTVVAQTYGATNNGPHWSGGYFDLWNVQFRYAGTRDRIAFKISAQAARLTEAEIFLPAVSVDGVQSAIVTWPGTLQGNDTGIQLDLVLFCRVHERPVVGFTKGVEYMGCHYNEVFCGHISDCKYYRVLNSSPLDLVNSFANENIFRGGRYGISSASNLLGDAFGIVYTWDHSVSYRGHNNNKFYDPCFEMGAPASATYRTPVLFDGAGSYNKVVNARVEGVKGPLMICDGGLVSGAGNLQASHNSFQTQFNNAPTATQDNSILSLNGAVHNRHEGLGCHTHHWGKQDLGKLLKSAGPAASAYLKGRELFVIKAAGAPTKVTAATADIAAHRSGLFLASNVRVGFAVDTSRIKDFLFSYAAPTGFPGRPLFYAFDANGAALSGIITDNPATKSANWLAYWAASKPYATLNQIVVNDTGKYYKLVTAGTSANSGGPTGTSTGIVDGTCVWDYVGTWGAEQYVKASLANTSGGGLLINSGLGYTMPSDLDSNKELLLTIRDEVKTLYVMVGGSTNPAVLQGFELEGRSSYNISGGTLPNTGATSLRIFSPLDDDGSLAKASANPATAGVHGYYQAGDCIGSNASPTSGAAAMWICTTTGWLAPAWTITTTYVVPGRLVVNDSGKIYQLVTAGTSAGATGPTGTGTAISDGTCVWAYVGVKAAFIAVNAA